MRYQEAARELPAGQRRTALIVCQAISMAITVVFPAPVVASLSARRINSGLASLLAAADVREVVCRLVPSATSVQPDCCFDGLDLTEERATLLNP